MTSQCRSTTSVFFSFSFAAFAFDFFFSFGGEGLELEFCGVFIMEMLGRQVIRKGCTVGHTSILVPEVAPRFAGASIASVTSDVSVDNDGTRSSMTGSGTWPKSTSFRQYVQHLVSSSESDTAEQGGQEEARHTSSLTSTLPFLNLIFTSL